MNRNRRRELDRRSETILALNENRSASDHSRPAHVSPPSQRRRRTRRLELIDRLLFKKNHQRNNATLSSCVIFSSPLDSCVFKRNSSQSARWEMPSRFPIQRLSICYAKEITHLLREAFLFRFIRTTCDIIAHYFWFQN